VLARAVILKHKGNTLTDVDAGVYDPSTGCLALFQLKWQDFGPSDVKKQRSRAKNFVSQVDQWANKVESWISDVGLHGVARALQLPARISAVRLFAIGRFTARFRSYGYAQLSEAVASSSWPQFARLCRELGSDDDILNKLHACILSERSRVLNIQPIPYETAIDGHKIVFENIWNSFDDGSGSPPNGAPVK
jgi:hypothetical protein